MEVMLGELADQSGFTQPEWKFLQDVTNGTMLFNPVFIQHLHLDIEDAHASYFEKWDVSKAELLEKVGRLDGLSRLAVIRRIDLLWSQD
jgi:hypothetical protein